MFDSLDQSISSDSSAACPIKSWTSKVGWRRRRKSVTYRLQDQFLNIAIRVAIYPVVLVFLNTILTGVWTQHAVRDQLVADVQLVTSTFRPPAQLPTERNMVCTSCTTFCMVEGTYSLLL